MLYICGLIMAKTKIKEVSRENHLTGEVTVHYSLYANKYTESFIMVRTTLGKDWFYALSNNEKNLLMMMWDWSSHEDMSVYLGTIRRKEVCTILCIGKRQITAILSSLCANDYVKRIGRDDFLVNPQFMFKCSVGQIRDKIKKYENYV
jgi:hypothetical protein